MAIDQNRNAISERAFTILTQAYGVDALFRSDQLEAIESVISGQNSLVVEKTGWGKSLVYFIATKILRQDGAGPTIIISPLLALMENQVDSARKLGIEAVTINSSNRGEWPEIYSNLDSKDAIIISPERLSDDKFMEQLTKIHNVRLIVIDEAHSISDWGHDFRPDYQRISKLIDGLPENVTILGTTATANDRVIDDIKAQLGNNLTIIRGNLIRENLAIQVNPLQTREERLAWLAQTLTGKGLLSKGQGVIYCLTHSDCLAVSEFLATRDVPVRPYYSGMGTDGDGNNLEKETLKSFMKGETRVLAATIKLGMGYDKTDIRFVIHFQLPQNLIAYYQQIGRAGRDGLPAYAFLLHGQEDKKIIDNFIKSAQVSPDLLGEVIRITKDGAKLNDLLGELNTSAKVLENALKYLLVHDYIYKDGSVYRRSIGKSFDADLEQRRGKQLAETKINEYRALLEYLKSSDCYMRHIAAELDAPDSQEVCGICANCEGKPLVPIDVDKQIIFEAVRYLKNRHETIGPRKKWSDHRRIQVEQRMEAGWILCADYHSEMGERVGKGKYSSKSFSDDLVTLAAKFLKRRVFDKKIDCIVPVPSRRHPQLVPSFAKRLAQTLGISYIYAVDKTCDTKEQKGLHNAVQQEKNIRESTAVINAAGIRGKTILLVDDMVDSRWTFTVIAAKVLEAGAACVYPFALVKTGSGD